MRGFLNKKEWTLVGHIGVDAGLCWIGDPCYILHQDKLPSTLGKNWEEFCKLMGEDYPTTKSFPYELGHEGLGCVVSTGAGDGVYPVYVKITSEGVSAVIVDFLGDAFSDEEN